MIILQKEDIINLETYNTIFTGEKGEGMSQEVLTELNLGQSLDDLMNLDPRGYGVCKILYGASRERAGRPLTMMGAGLLKDTLKEGGLVYILTGFVLPPHGCPETDGVIGSVLLARALVKAYEASPVLIVPKDCVEAVKELSHVAGLHCYETIEDACSHPAAMGVVAFTKDSDKALDMAEQMMVAHMPDLVCTIEAPGANKVGVYHNAKGVDITQMQAKSDLLFEKLVAAGVPNLAIGDLGNESGLGTLIDHIQTYIPYAGSNGCECGCKGGTAARAAADNVLTATVSDWGVYGLISALAYLENNLELIHDGDLEEAMMRAASRMGLVDMTGWLTPGIDGFDIETNRLIAGMMKMCVKQALSLKNTCKPWFEGVEVLSYFKQKEEN